MRDREYEKWSFTRPSKFWKPKCCFLVLIQWKSCLEAYFFQEGSLDVNPSFREHGLEQAWIGFWFIIWNIRRQKSYPGLYISVFNNYWWFCSKGPGQNTRIWHEHKNNSVPNWSRTLFWRGPVLNIGRSTLTLNKSTIPQPVDRDWNKRFPGPLKAKGKRQKTGTLHASRAAWVPIELIWAVFLSWNGCAEVMQWFHLCGFLMYWISNWIRQQHALEAVPVPV